MRKVRRPIGQRVMLVCLELFAAAWLGLGGYVVGRDATEFHELLRSGVPAPWVSDNWWEQPYTHARLALCPHKDYWTAVHNQWWHVREYDFHGVTFRTVLNRSHAEPASVNLPSI